MANKQQIFVACESQHIQPAMYRVYDYQRIVYMITSELCI